MRISRLKLRNWRNFRNVEVSDLPGVVYVVGPNGSGKSNFLDALNFLGDVANPAGGGLQDAVRKRGGMGRVRCMYASESADVEIEIDLSDDRRNILWTYGLTLRSSKQTEGPFVARELVIRHYKTRPSKKVHHRVCGKKNKIPSQFFKTGFEQLEVGKDFRSLSEFLKQIKYYYPVPQLIRFGAQIGGELLIDDPFGQNFINHMLLTDREVRINRIKKIQQSLKSVIPDMDNLNLRLDKESGRPHLEVKLKRFNGHRRPTLQEDQLSDGTIRLIAMLWICHEVPGRPVIIEEAELSINDGIVEDLSMLFEKSLEGSREKGQLFVSTHNGSLLSNPGINPEGLVVLKRAKEGSNAEKMNDSEWSVAEAGFPPYDAVFTSVERASKINLGL